jgi:hypothetical protein
MAKGDDVSSTSNAGRTYMPTKRDVARSAIIQVAAELVSDGPLHPGDGNFRPLGKGAVRAIIAERHRMSKKLKKAYDDLA